MTKSLTIIAALLATAACQPQAPPNEAIAQGNKVVAPDLPENRNSTPPVGATPVAPPPSQPVPNKADSPPPLPAIPDSDKTPAAAKKVVEAYFAALSERHYADAYRMFPGSGMSASAFAASYAKYRTFKATVGVPGDTEGGAGSILHRDTGGGNRRTKGRWAVPDGRAGRAAAGQRCRRRYPGAAPLAYFLERIDTATLGKAALFRGGLTAAPSPPESGREESHHDRRSRPIPQ